MLPVSRRAVSRCKPRLFLPPPVFLESGADSGSVIRLRAILAAGIAAERCCGRLRGREKRGGSGSSACSAVAAGGCFAASKRDFKGKEMLGTAASELAETPSARLGGAPAARAGLSPCSRCRWCHPRQLLSSPVVSDWGSTDRTVSSC